MKRIESTIKPKLVRRKEHAWNSTWNSIEHSCIKRSEYCKLKKACQYTYLYLVKQCIFKLARQRWILSGSYLLDFNYFFQVMQCSTSDQCGDGYYCTSHLGVCCKIPGKIDLKCGLRGLIAILLDSWDPWRCQLRGSIKELEKDAQQLLENGSFQLKICTKWSKTFKIYRKIGLTSLFFCDQVFLFDCDLLNLLSILKLLIKGFKDFVLFLPCVH